MGRSMLVEGPRSSGNVAPNGPFSLISTISGDTKEAGEGGDWGRRWIMENFLLLVALLRLLLNTEASIGAEGGEEGEES